MKFSLEIREFLYTFRNSEYTVLLEEIPDDLIRHVVLLGTKKWIYAFYVATVRFVIFKYIYRRACFYTNFNS